MAFWFVEVPAMGLRGDFYRLNALEFTGLVLTHTVPVLVCFTEWRVSAIPIGWIRYPFYFLVALGYVIMLAFL